MTNPFGHHQKRCLFSLYILSWGSSVPGYSQILINEEIALKRGIKKQRKLALHRLQSEMSGEK